jgi:hypothetical protein
MNCHSVSEDNRNKRASKEKRGRKKTEDSRKTEVEDGGALRSRVEAKEGMMEYWKNGMLENKKTEENPKQSRKHENWKTRKRAGGFMKPSSFVSSSFRAFVMSLLLFYSDLAVGLWPTADS